MHGYRKKMVEKTLENPSKNHRKTTESERKYMFFTSYI